MAAKKTKKTTKKQQSEEKPPNEKVERFTENLPVVLTDEQIADRANRSAHRVAERDHLEEELKAYNKDAKGRIAKVESEIRHLSDEVRTKTTYQDVKCERRYNYDTGRVIEIRNDTGVVITDREMNQFEIQRELDLEEKTDIDDEFADTPQDGDDEPPESGTAGQGDDEEEPAAE